eukprot:TRINITY_DN4939_c0_g1_i1.p1 TRINITY_DN4939_c0_g1~~TRINITY_DN4939_c0_g1_i1.p1  ORF type:complete len:143 (+),score=4.32 TRINITY_DN4939_c0_g1_i1:784-1212(+)
MMLVRCITNWWMVRHFLLISKSCWRAPSDDDLYVVVLFCFMYHGGDFGRQTSYGHCRSIDLGVSSSSNKHIYISKQVLLKLKQFLAMRPRERVKHEQQGVDRLEHDEPLLGDLDRCIRKKWKSEENNNGPNPTKTKESILQK